MRVCKVIKHLTTATGAPTRTCGVRSAYIKKQQIGRKKESELWELAQHGCDKPISLSIRYYKYFFNNCQICYMTVD